MSNTFEIHLRPTKMEDLPELFQFQLNKEAGYLAAFMPEDPTNQSAYITKYTRLLSDSTVNNQTILIDDVIVGSIAKFEIDGAAELTYWIDKKHWGKGVATNALSKFLMIETARPLCGRLAYDNLGSQKVLEKCGFIKVGTDRGFANARQMEIEEYIYTLTAT